MSDPSLSSILLALLFTAIAAAWDLRTGVIPNRLVAVGAAACAVVGIAAAAAGGPYEAFKTLLTMAMGMLLVALVPFILFRAGGMGGGDVKLLAAVGVALGPLLGLEAELYAFMVAMLYAPARLIWEGRLLHAFRTIGTLAVRPLIPKHKRPASVPLEEMTALRFGPAIFIGTVLTAVHHLGVVR